MNLSNKRAASSKEARIDWLINHLDLWVGMPGTMLEYSNALRKGKHHLEDNWKKIVKTMKKAGLIAPTTYWSDVKIPEHCRLARLKMEDDLLKRKQAN